MSWNRITYRALLILSFLTVNAAILVAISAVLSYLNTGADRATILHLPKEQAPSYQPELIWAPLANEGRPISTQTLSELERDYLKAWYVRSIALETNNPYGVSDYYTDSARVKLYTILELNAKNQTHIKSTTLRHHPTLEFYSADGKIAVLTDTAVELIEQAFVNGQPLARRRERASYQIMLLLEDGFWRIRHMVKLPPLKIAVKQPPSVTLNSVADVKGINYYPQHHPWEMFGANFSDSIIRRDFAKIRQMGLNTVRIFVPYSSFGKTRLQAKKLAQLRQTLDNAAANKLKVIVTLFDFYGDYSLRDWTLTHRHAQQIVTAMKSHEALLAWDIKNEPDLDFKTRGQTQVLAWLQQLVLEVKSWDPRHPVTIGWSSPEAAIHLKEEVDFVSFHYYREPDRFKQALEELKSQIPHKPLVLQEYGYSSYEGIWNAYLGSDEDQADYFKTMQEVLDAEELPFLFWTLYDFETVPNTVVGRWPWRKARQKHFGLLDRDGKPKAAYLYIDSKK